MLCALFALGLVCCAATIPRLVALTQDKGDPDTTHRLAGIVLWSELELFFGISTASVITLRRPIESCLARLGIPLGSSKAPSSGGMAKWNGKRWYRYGRSDGASYRPSDNGPAPELAVKQPPNMPTAMSGGT